MRAGHSVLAEEAGAPPVLMALREPRLARAVLAVLEKPGAPYSVESLAVLAGMSRTSFADRFSQVFEQAPMDFVQRVRLRIAARLLTTTDLPVKVIASTIGYASRTAFSRAFERSMARVRLTFEVSAGRTKVSRSHRTTVEEKLPWRLHPDFRLPGAPERPGKDARRP